MNSTTPTPTASPVYGTPRTWPAGRLLQVTRGPSGGTGENHNRAHPQYDTTAVLARTRRG